MKQGGKTLLQSSSNPRSCSDGLKMKGVVEYLVYHHGKLVDRQVLENIIFYQGNGAIIRSLATISPSTLPAIINRMAVGDQGTIPSSSITPKVPTKDLPQVLATNGLYHEVYRKDIDSSVITTNNGATFTPTCTIVAGSTVVTTTDTSSLAAGMSVSGTYIPVGDVIGAILSSTQFTIGPGTPTQSTVEVLTISGAANQVQFSAQFNAPDIALSAYTNPSNPVLNEVGLVLINPAAPSGITRSPVTAPTAPPSDEVIMSIRTFPSIPFTIANDVSVTIRYTIYMV
jgi:hypothetical protein